MKKAMFGAGCFWGVEAAFRKIPGVVKTQVGYSGGHAENPSYEEVCSGKTGHAETVLVEFDPEKVPYSGLLKAFWEMHDPTTKDRQGPDVGTQYRSVIFTFSEDQKQDARLLKEELEHSGKFQGPLVTEIEEAGPFYPAEEYHQCYLEKKGL